MIFLLFQVLLMFVMQAWAPWTQADKDLLEDVQKRAVRATSGLRSESYKRKLEELGLTPLEEHRHRQCCGAGAGRSRTF